MKKRDNHLLLEFTEFNMMRMGRDVVPQSTHVDNPHASFGSYNRFQMNLAASINRLTDVYRNINMSSAGMGLTGSKDLIKLDSFKNIKCLKIAKNRDIYYDIYFTFILDINDKEYYGVIENMNSAKPNVRSEIFKDESLYLTNDFVMRIKGNLIKAFNIWLNIRPGIYTCLVDDIICIERDSGKQLHILYNTDIEVRRTNNNEIHILYDGKKCILKDTYFYFFNYWFEPKKK